MRVELLLRAAELVRRGEPFVLATVTWRQAPSSAQRGDSALVTADGTFHGWLGGACTRPTVERAAREALRDGKPRLIALDPDAGAALARPGVEVYPMTCHSGGSVEIYLEPVLPPPRLVVFGGSPAARTLARLGQAMGYTVTAVAPQPDFAGFPPDLDLRTAAREGDRLLGTATRPLYAVVATMGEDDEASLRAALGLQAAYVGVVASRRRFTEIRATLVAGGANEAALDAVKSPAGLDLGGRTPEEIALSILAEIVQARRSAAAPTPGSADAATPGSADAPTVSLRGAPATKQSPDPEIAAGPAGPRNDGPLGPRGAAVEPATAVDPATAIDPICGMTVEVAGSRHQVEHAGTTYHFCCGGCRERFLADPARYVAAAEPSR